MRPRLNLQLAKQLTDASELDAIRSAPVRVLQVGTGVFLRAFCGWMFERLNRYGLFRGGIAVAQATPASRTTQLFREQEGCYTVLQRGLQDGRPVEKADLVTCVRQALNPYAEWPAFLACGASPNLRYIISNTTEAGIVYKRLDTAPAHCPATFPAQMAALLHHRFRVLGGTRESGLVFFPCEITERNGSLLQDIVLRHAADWRLGDSFMDWVRGACTFCNTLVDRIVPGYPKDEIEPIQQRLGYEDALLVGCEPYHLWVIECPRALAAELPFDRAGLNVVWTDDVTPYRTRKVRIVNGVHTATVAAAFLAGIDTVLQCMNHPVVYRFIEHALFDEIVPTLGSEVRPYALEVLDRFRNPTVQHRLLSITLNSTSKWNVRVLPSLLDYLEKQGKLPRRLTFSLAALIVLYRVQVNERGAGTGSRQGEPYELVDTMEALQLLSDAWKNYDERGDVQHLARSVLSQTSLWDADLNPIPGLTAQVAADVEMILRDGMMQALEKLERGA